MLKIEELKDLEGTKVLINTESEVKLLGGKKNPMLGKVTKKTFGTVVTLGGQGIYQQRMVESGTVDKDFVPKKRTWGTRIGSSCLIEHKGNVYVDMFIEEFGTSTYWFEGKEIPKADVQGLKPSTGNDVGLVTRKLSSILEMAKI